MKFLKMLCIVITFVMLFGSLSINRIFAAQYDTSPLQNTYHKLISKKEITIGYIGGSVTSGSGSSDLYTKSWRALTTKWFKTQFPDAAITERSMSVGGTGTIYALHRVEKALLTGNVPDLVFIETAINDSYDGISGDTLKVYLESLIKKIYAKNPKCDIVMVIIGDFNALREARQSGKLFRPEHREIANYYNIPIIDIGTEFYQRIYKENGNEDIFDSSAPAWQKHFEDAVHPNDGGYAEYAKLVQKYLSGELVSKKLDATVFSNKNIPKKTYMQNLMLDAYDVDFTNFDFENNTYFEPEEYSGVFARFNGIFSKRIGDTFTVEFTGTSFMIWTHPTTFPTSAADTVIRYSIDGGKKQTLKITAGFHGVYPLAQNLAPGKHKIKIIYMENAQKHKLVDMFIAGDPSMSGVKFTIEPSADDLEEMVESENVGTSNNNKKPTYDDEDDYEINNSSKTNECANHKFSSWKEKTKATCTTKGAQSRTCLNCGYEETKYSETSNHVFEESKIIKEATIYSVGIEEGKCIHCGEDTQQELMCSARDNDTQLYFETNVGTFEEGTELKVNKLSKSDDVYKSTKKSLKSVSKKFVAYNISALQNGKAVQPKGEVKIVLPVPDDYQNVEIYQIGEDLTPKKLEAILSFDGKAATVTVTELGTIAICERTEKETNINSLAIIGVALVVFAVLLVTAVIIFWLKIRKA